MKGGFGFGDIGTMFKQAKDDFGNANAFAEAMNAAQSGDSSKMNLIGDKIVEKSQEVNYFCPPFCGKKLDFTDGKRLLLKIW